MYSSYSVETNNFPYNLKLLYPNNRVIGRISEDYVQGFEEKFNDICSISLRVPKFVTNSTGQRVELYLYKDLTSGKLITMNEKHCFYVENYQEENEGTENAIKTLTCYTRDKKLEKQFFDIGNSSTLQIRKDAVNVSDGILDYFCKDQYYTMGYIDPDAYQESINGGLSNKYRWMEAGQKSWSQLLVECKQAFKSLFLLDTYNKVINVYDENNIGTFNGLYLSFDNFVKKINKKTNAETVYTRLYIDSGSNQDVDVSEANPLGTNYIERFDYYFNEMSPELVTAIKKYNTIVDAKYTEFLVIKNDIVTIQSQINTINTNLTSLDEAIKAQKALQVEFISKKDNVSLAPVTTEINRLNALSAQNIASKGVLQSQIDVKNQLITNITTYLNKETCKDSSGNLVFTNGLLEELNEFIVCGSYSNEYQLTSTGLYDDAVKELIKIQTPNIEFELDVVAFVNMIKSPNLDWNKVLTMGNYALIEMFDKTKEKCRLIGLNHTPQKGSTEPTLKLLFSNKPYEFKTNPISSAVAKGSSAKSTLNQSKGRWNNYKEYVDFAKDVKMEGLNLKAQEARGAGNTTKIYIDDRGILLVDATNENNQVFINSSSFCISQDAFATCTTAIDETGVIAETILGTLILGQKLTITDSTGMFKITGSGLSIYDENNTLKVFLGIEKQNGVSKGVLRLYNSDGTQVVVDNSGMLNHWQFVYSDNLDATYPIDLPIIMDDGIQDIRSAKLTIIPQSFRSYERGVASGGGGIVSTTSENGGGYSNTFTSEGGGSYTSSISSKAQKWNNFDYTTDGGEVDFVVEQIPPYGIDGVRIQYEKFSHYHISDIVVPSHIHQVSTSYPAHKHSVSINLQPHIHNSEKGIYLGSKSSNISVYVNGTLRASNINTTTTIDITQYMNLNSTNTISIHSATLGRCTANLYIKSFVSH